MNYCKRCLTPDTRPRIVFKDGVCNACIYAEKKNNQIIDYSHRKKELDGLVEKIKRFRFDNVGCSSEDSPFSAKVAIAVSDLVSSVDNKPDEPAFFINFRVFKKIFMSSIF